jgi:hypothetical protein
MDWAVRVLFLKKKNQKDFLKLNPGRFAAIFLREKPGFQ